MTDLLSSAGAGSRRGGSPTVPPLAGARGTAGPPPPRAKRRSLPSWLDARLVAGVLLVIGSVLIGVRVLGTADDTEPVWALRHDLAVGSVLASSDVTTVRVRLGKDTAQAYVGTDEAVAGKRLASAVRAGELLPRAGLINADDDVIALAAVTIGVDSQSAPDVVRGNRVSVWVSARGCRAVPILTDVVVSEVRAGGGGLAGSNDLSIVVQVPVSVVTKVVAALDLSGAVIRVAVLTGPGPSGPASAPDLSTCVTT